MKEENRINEYLIIIIINVFYNAYYQHWRNVCWYSLYSLIVSVFSVRNI